MVWIKMVDLQAIAEVTFSNFYLANFCFFSLFFSVPSVISVMNVTLKLTGQCFLCSHFIHFVPEVTEVIIHV